MTVKPPASRDLRLDFFRGLSLWFIFINHIPSNTMSWLTNRNYGFSDAAEIFVFLSGYTAAFVYGRVMRERGFVVAGARILKRVWQLYVAFVLLSVIYIAQTAYVAHQFDNPLFADEMVVLHFLQRPEIILLDEPTSGVSTAEKATIMRVLVEAAKHTGIKAIIQVEHDMDIVFGYSSRIVAVHNGRILADGTPEAIRSQPDVMTTVVGRL